MNRRTVRKAEALNGQKYIYIYKQTNKHTKEVKQIKKQIKNKTKQNKTKVG